MKYYSQTDLDADKAWLDNVVIWLGISMYYGLPPVWMPFEQYWQALVVWTVFGTILLGIFLVLCRTGIAIYRVYIKKGIKER